MAIHQKQHVRFMKGQTKSKYCRARESVELLSREDGRYLANLSEHPIRRLVYSKWAYIPWDSQRKQLFVTERPYYEVEDLPGRSVLFLESFDTSEEGRVFFRLEAVEWEDGTKDEAVLLPAERGAVAAALARGSRLRMPDLRHRGLVRARRTPELVKTDEAGTVSDEVLEDPGEHQALQGFSD